MAQGPSRRAPCHFSLVVRIDLGRPSLNSPLEETSAVANTAKVKRWEVMELVKGVCADGFVDNLVHLGQHRREVGT